MQLDFRQGIARARTIGITPDFLSWNSVLSTIDIGITAPWLIVSAAFKTHNYLIEERGSQSQAWGPFSWNPLWGPIPTIIIWQLYWDINTATGVITKFYTPWAPITSFTTPINPLIDQHWYSLADNIMYVWDSQFWQVKCRVFAGSFGPSLNQIIHELIDNSISNFKCNPQLSFHVILITIKNLNNKKVQIKTELTCSGYPRIASTISPNATQKQTHLHNLRWQVQAGQFDQEYP